MSRIREWLIANALVIVTGVAALALVFGACQTVRIEGLQLRLPLIGTVGPKGFKPKLVEAGATISKLEQWRDNMVIAVRLATGNAQTSAATAEAQVNELGVIRIRLKTALDEQNAAITALARESEVARAVAEQARRQRAAANRRAEQLAAELRARAVAPAADMEAAVRRSQDELYEAGL